MKIINKVTVFLFVLAIINTVQAQVQDSTYTPWTAAAATTFEANPPSGTSCGLSAYDARWNGHPEWGPTNGGFQTYVLCQGHLPYYSCPSGYYQAPAGESGQGMYFHTCIKY